MAAYRVQVKNALVGSRQSGVGSLSRQSQSAVRVVSLLVNPWTWHQPLTRSADSECRLGLPTEIVD